MQSHIRNSTYDDATDDKTSIILWYVCEIVSLICGLFVVYLMLCVILFVRRQLTSQTTNHVQRFKSTIRTCNRRTNSSSSNEGEDSTKANRPGLKELKNDPGKWMYLALFSTLIVAFLRFVNEQMILMHGNDSDHKCNVYSKVMIILTGFCIHGCLVFLWCRQLAFYANPLLRHIRANWLVRLSYVTYLHMFSTLTISMVLHLWWRDYTVQQDSCTPSVESYKTTVYVPFVFLVISTISIQLLLTFLFVYPIICHNRQMRNRVPPKSPTLPTRSRCTSGSRVRLFKCVKRALVSATLGITTDVVGALVAMWLPNNIPMFGLSVLYHLNIILNILCLFFTYVDWTDIILPFKGRICYKGREIDLTPNNV
ncbi:uncharacterized protein LOC144744577 [Ciona intestinalis]